MQFISFVESIADLKECQGSEHIKEVLIEAQEFSRLGKLSLDEASGLAKNASTIGLSPVLVWDILITEADLGRCAALLSNDKLQVFSAVRVSDLGAAEWLRKAGSVAIQLICERGNNNLEALRGWEEYFGASLSRLILSPELPESSICRYCHELKTPLEILGAGPIEIFYSKRRLLLTDSDQDDKLIESLVLSEEAKQHPIRCVESKHGTFLFLDEDYFILDKLRNLAGADLHTLRIDLREQGSCKGIAALADLTIRGLNEEVSIPWHKAYSAFFLKTNKTTKQFNKLKSRIFAGRDETCIAQIIAAEKNRFIAFQFTRSSELSGPFEIILPTGETRSIQHLHFRTVSLEPKNTAEAGELLLATWIPKMQAGGLLRTRPAFAKATACQAE